MSTQIPKLSDLRSGQRVKVYYKISEGSKSRIQPYEGLIIAIKGSLDSKTITVRHSGTDNVGVERIFPLSSPNIEKIEVMSTGKVRRSKIYYVRKLSEKTTRKRLRE